MHNNVHKIYCIYPALYLHCRNCQVNDMWNMVRVHMKHKRNNYLYLIIHRWVNLFEQGHAWLRPGRQADGRTDGWLSHNRAEPYIWWEYVSHMGRGNSHCNHLSLVARLHVFWRDVPWPWFVFPSLLINTRNRLNIFLDHRFIYNVKRQISTLIKTFCTSTKLLSISAPSVWNDLYLAVRSFQTLDTFKSHLEIYLFTQSYIAVSPPANERPHLRVKPLLDYLSAL